MRDVLLAFALILGAVVPFEAAAPEEAPPLVPFIASFNHFDHHWFEWTPADAHYEAIEAMVADLPGGGHDILVFQTERAGEKRQVFYSNNRATADSGFAIYRNIEYRINGDQGAAASMHVALRDDRQRLIRWSIDFSAHTELTPVSGLTDQRGHGAGAAFMLFYRAKEATTEKNRLQIGDADYTLNAESIGKLPFCASYSAHVFIATLRYGDAKVVATSDGVATIEGSRFTRRTDLDGNTDWVSEPYAGRAIDLRFNAGNLCAVSYSTYGHSFTMRIAPGLSGDPQTSSPVN